MKDAPIVKVGEQYEFSGGQNVPIRDLAGKMKFVGISLIVLGIVQLAVFLFTWDWGSPLNAVFHILIGTWTHRAAAGFRKIVDTKGHDITHLMTSLRNLRSMYTLMY